jgi:hypothetical protein
MILPLAALRMKRARIDVSRDAVLATQEALIDRVVGLLDVRVTELFV